MIVWPFRPNWTQPYAETYSYLTEIITSDSGREQRRALRDSARRSVEYSILVEGSRFHELRGLLNRRSEQIVFPDEVRVARPSVAAVNGSDTVTFAAIPAWMVGGRQVVFEDAVTQERVVRTIDAVDGMDVEFSNLNDRAWGTTTRIMPVLFGQLSPSTTASLKTNRTGVVPIRLEVEPGTEQEAASSAAVTFNGREVMTIAPNWTQTPSIEVLDPTEWTDNGVSVRVAYRPVEFNTSMMQAEYLLRSAGDVDAILGAFQRSRGRRGEFYQATGFEDFSLLQTVSSGSAFWRVPGHDFHAAYDGDTVHRAFAVVLRSGVTLRFSVLDITTGGTTTPYSQIQTSAAAPYAINPADVVMISWLPVVRFVSDELTLTWRTDQVADATVNTQTLEDL
jgi:hypothetical protein